MYIHIFAYIYIYDIFGVSQVALVVKKPPANAGDIRDTSSIPGSRRSLEESVATHSSILASSIPWTDEPGGLKSMGSQSQTRLKQLGTQHARVTLSLLLDTQSIS